MLDAYNLNHTQILAELDILVAETYQLWEQEWVGFSWRNYTYDHVQRVRGLAKTLCGREGGDILVANYAGLLHDITKSYDGEILMRDGRRILDEQGFWKNEVLLPSHQNRVTSLYDQLNLTGTFHNISGARIAEALLREYGLPDDLVTKISEAIGSHLKPDPKATIEGRCLYDADTIDANIGLPAFYRNIQINLHREERQLAQQTSLDAYLKEHMPEYLGPYLREKVPDWIYGKNNDFVPKMTTESGRAVALERIGRLRETIQFTADELENYPANATSGRLAIVQRFMMNNRNPALSKELAYLSNHWQHEASPSSAAAALISQLRAEVEGSI